MELTGFLMDMSNKTNKKCKRGVKMIEEEKQEKTDRISNASTYQHQEFIERKKTAPIIKRKPLPSFHWLEELLDILSDFFT